MLRHARGRAYVGQLFGEHGPELRLGGFAVALKKVDVSDARERGPAAKIRTAGVRDLKQCLGLMQPPAPGLPLTILAEESEGAPRFIAPGAVLFCGRIP